jgi:putative inorganic carbon (HCO3(-)) transporter
MTEDIKKRPDWWIQANKKTSNTSLDKHTDFNFAVWFKNPILKKNMVFLLGLMFCLTLSILLKQVFPYSFYLVGAALVPVILYMGVKEPERIFALTVVYLPFSKGFPFDIAPFINGTNFFVFILLLNVLRLPTQFKPFKELPIFFFFCAVLGVATIISFVYTFIRSSAIELGSIRFAMVAWVMQFLIAYCFYRFFDTPEKFFRLLIYLMAAAIIFVAYLSMEWLDKRGLSSIEKMRLSGPQDNANLLASALLMSSASAFGLFLIIKGRWRFILALAGLWYLKILFMTFSRAALLSFAIAALATFYLRSKALFLVISASFAMVVLFVPSVLPDSVTARFNQTFEDNPAGTQVLDKSGHDRLIMWDGGIRMMLDNPFGVGFDRFRLEYLRYIQAEVNATDPHNMYLYVGTNMGYLGLFAFIGFLLVGLVLSIRLTSQKNTLYFWIGLSGVYLWINTLILNFFGTRLIDVGAASFFWIFLAIIIRAHVLIRLNGNKV